MTRTSDDRGFNPSYRGYPHRTLVRQLLAAAFVILLVGSVLIGVAADADAHHQRITVQRGDTLAELSNEHDSPGGWKRLAGRNRLRDPDRIHVGQKLVIPHRASGVTWPNYAKARRQPTTSRSTDRSGGYSVTSTAYCLTGTMANGQRAHRGAVAMNGPAFGTKYYVHSGPLAGQTLTVKDRIGHGSDFDIALPGDCGAARQYGRRTIRISRR